MTDLLSKGSEWLESQRTEHMTRLVAYQRGTASVELPATVGRTLFRIDKGYGVQEHYESRDYLVLAGDLILGGAPVLPKAGDRVRETDGGKVFVYEVMAPGNEPAWRYSDPYRQTLRIHTKLVATEDTP